MAERVNQSNSNSVRHVASSSPSKPLEPQQLQQASSDFASLMSGESTGENQVNDAPPERNTDTQDDQRVQERESRQESDSGEKDGEGEQKKPGKESKQEGERTLGEEALSPGEAILKSFGKSFAAAETQQQKGAQQNLENVVQQVADKVLVSDTGSGREVRILLKDSVLPGTQVRITQHAGKMQIQFVSDSSQSHDVLTQNQATLQSRLNDKLSSEVVVSVEMESEGHGDQPQGESRGKQEQDLEDEQD